jgi:GTP-binding protein EngB required for normal cell division
LQSFLKLSNNSDNCFLFLGKTGVGKSLCAKLLTENKNIEVSDSKSSVTSEITSYNAHIPSSFLKKN